MAELAIIVLAAGEEEVGSPSLEGFLAEHAAELKADGVWWEFGSITPEGRPVRVPLRGHDHRHDHLF